MHVSATPLPDVYLIEPDVHEDERGYFYESFNQREFARAVGLPCDDAGFVQDNHTRSRRGVLRGLHYQVRQPQGKLVRAVSGEIFDVAVDIRSKSPTYGKWFGTRLSAANRRQLWLPPGFAHGFLVLSDAAEVLYKCTEYYAPAHEAGIRWDDPGIGIAWPLTGPPVLSAKDRNAPQLSVAEAFT
ncbi:dTDP-4-dehydrorhamnose 3,5-epimerase [Noviherbaspirillum aridicola]|uniref:dTDP-4-dehydrorhamnose 3,5-epimerase n=1 Tax=Noviherbaspirillum aridicola TaxID=2849687 RepID=A0ABQ4Q357_9BURK|nr:dTDP-4-dehydrorhamnose 3,5-epimerase [Noviherbaspirillum aridicola]GIZ51618.1 dTDP-4-dehydrorhamnose 3,5-epimerase [Noviherbaspirillum aridicola]